MLDQSELSCVDGSEMSPKGVSVKSLLLGLVLLGGCGTFKR